MSDTDDEHEKHFCGLYRGVVKSNGDMLARGRLMLTIPDVHGTSTVWALPCQQRGGGPVPSIGSAVWVMFEHGDPEHAVWMGVLNPNGG